MVDDLVKHQRLCVSGGLELYHALLCLALRELLYISGMAVSYQRVGLLSLLSLSHTLRGFMFGRVAFVHTYVPTYLNST